MTPEFKIYQIGDSQIIERLTYPRFTGIIKNSVESDIDIENVLADCRWRGLRTKNVRLNHKI